MKQWLYLLLIIAPLLTGAQAAQADDRCQFLVEGGHLNDDGFFGI